MSLSDLLSSDHFLKLVELRPPKGVVLDTLNDVADRLRGRVDAVMVPDNPGAIASLGAVSLCRRMLEKEHGVVLRLSCRDSNRIALQSLLLGAYVDGIRDVVIARGNESAYGDHPSASVVYDVEPHELLAALRDFAEGKDMAGNEIDGAPAIAGGAEFNPWLEGEERRAELAAVEKRVGAGAAFLMAPPVHDPKRFEDALSPFAGLGLPVIARVMLLKSVGMARYLNRNVAGDRVPDETIKRLRKAADKGEESLKIAADLAHDLRGVCRGVCFQPLGWEGRLPALMELT